MKLSTSLNKKLWLLVLFWLAIAGCSNLPQQKEQTYLSDTLVATKPAPHMQGPASIKHFSFPHSSGEQNIVWLTGVSVKNTLAHDGQAHNLCHVFVQEEAHQTQKLKRQWTHSGLHFVLGMNQKSLQFPPGFGIPIPAGSPMKYTSSLATHHGFKKGDAIKERYELNLKYQTLHKMKPLHRVSLTALVPLHSKACVFGQKKGDPKSCASFRPIASGISMKDAFQNTFTPHFYIPPGRHRILTEVTHLLPIPRDTRAHYISSHIHPGVEKIRLLQGLEKKEIYSLQVSGHHHQNTPVYSSPKGIAIKARQKYFLEILAHNPTQKDVDIMASLHLYLFDTEFQRPETGASDLAKKH